MKLATALTRPFARLRAWLSPEISSATKNAIRMLGEQPDRFEIVTDQIDPTARGAVFIQPKAGSNMAFGRICLRPNMIWIERAPRPTELLSDRERVALLQAVQAWLPTFN